MPHRGVTMVSTPTERYQVGTILCSVTRTDATLSKSVLICSQRRYSLGYMWVSTVTMSNGLSVFQPSALHSSSFPLPVTTHSISDLAPCARAMQQTIEARDATVAEQVALLAERDVMIAELNAQIERLTLQVKCEMRPFFRRSSLKVAPDADASIHG